MMKLLPPKYVFDCTEYLVHPYLLMCNMVFIESVHHIKSIITYLLS